MYCVMVWLNIVVKWLGPDGTSPYSLTEHLWWDKTWWQITTYTNICLFNTVYRYTLILPFICTWFIPGGPFTFWGFCMKTCRYFHTDPSMLCVLHCNLILLQILKILIMYSTLFLLIYQHIPLTHLQSSFTVSVHITQCIKL